MSVVKKKREEKKHLTHISEWVIETTTTLYVLHKIGIEFVTAKNEYVNLVCGQ